MLDADDDLRAAFARIWPLLDPEALLRGLWASADMLATCAPWLTGADVAVLTRAAGADWTHVDLPSLDAARLSPSGSFTIVGDRAQARHGFTETWEERVGRVGVGRVTVSTLTIGYRTPEEVMAVAEPVIRAALPDASVPRAIRHSGLPARHGPVVDLERIITEWANTHAEGVAVVIGAPWFPPRDRVRSLDPERVKGLEFDLVVLVDPEGFGDGLTGAVDRYVAMTRATAQLVLLTS